MPETAICMVDQKNGIVQWVYHYLVGNYRLPVKDFFEFPTLESPLVDLASQQNLTVYPLVYGQQYARHSNKRKI